MGQAIDSKGRIVPSADSDVNILYFEGLAQDNPQALAVMQALGIESMDVGQFKALVTVLRREKAPD